MAAFYKFTLDNMVVYANDVPGKATWAYNATRAYNRPKLAAQLVAAANALTTEIPATLIFAPEADTMGIASNDTQTFNRPKLADKWVAVPQPE